METPQTLEEFAQLFEKLYPNHDFQWKVYQNRIMGLCPFHPDTKPSFNIYEFEGVFYYKCFSCGIKGSVYSLLGKEHRDRATEAGQIFLLQEIVDKAVDNLLNNLEDTQVLAFLNKIIPCEQSVRIEETVKFYQVGFVNGTFLDRLASEPVYENVLRKLRKVLGRTSSCIIFPYYALSGHLSFVKIRDFLSSSKFVRTLKVSQSTRPAYFGGSGFLKDYLKRNDGWVYPVAVTEGETDSLSIYTASGVPALAVGSASNYSFLLQERFSEFGFFPIIFPDFDRFTPTSPGPGLEAVLKLYENRRKKKVREKIYVLVERSAYDGAKDINEALVVKKKSFTDIMQSDIRELSEAVRLFKQEWEEWKYSLFVDRKRAIEESSKSLAFVYADFLGIKEEVQSEFSARELLELNIEFTPPLLGRFPVWLISALASFGGSGKTTMAMMDAYRIAKEGLRVLFWTTEHGLASLQQKLRSLELSREFWEFDDEIKERVAFKVDMPVFTFLDSRGNLNKEAIEVIGDLFRRYDVIFLDPLLSFLGSAENDNSEVRAVFNEIHKILREYENRNEKKAMIILHHFNKYGLREVLITEENITRLDGNVIQVSQEKINGLKAAVRGAGAVVDAARYVEAIVKTDRARYCVTIKTNEIGTRQEGEGEIIPEITWYAAGSSEGEDIPF
ncbi:AAA family ATPase [Desulfurobacterium sp.]